MHSKNKSKERGKGIGRRALSVVLSVLMLVSVLYVGSVASVQASAVDANSEVFVAFYESDGLRWWPDSAEIGVWIWGGAHDEYNRLQFVKSTNTYSLYKFTPTVAFTGFKLLRYYGTDENFTTLDKAKQWGNIVIGTTDGMQQTHDLSASGWSSSSNCFFMHGQDKNGDSNTDPTSTDEMWLTTGAKPNLGQDTSSVKGGNDFSAGIGYNVDGDVKLFPVQAKFYDYLTDYEMANGWRCNDDYETSRTFLHRIPYIEWNSYISSLTGGEGGDWAYPLYFGNFTSDWGEGDGNFNSYPYGTLLDKHIYDSDQDGPTGYFGSTNGHLRHEHQIGNYTANRRLSNFSIYANDSEPIAKKNGANGYSGSVQGLVSDTLDGNQLYMKTKTGSILSPYFTHDSSGGNHEYINTVSTSFPMRINDTNNGGTHDGKSTTYTTYEFDSKGKTSGASDNVYFDYSNGVPQKIYYSQDSSAEVIDAYKSLGGNTGNDHRGFFPFDNGGIGHDYGFGMRLDIPFNLTEDGNVLSVDSDGMYHKTDIPMEFDFEGDDDVWVFVDGRLALDLGGDHGNTKGKINFSLNKSTADGVGARTGAPLTGAFVLKSNPSYGSTEYQGTGSATSLTLAEGSYNDAGDKYNPTKIHTLTVFYMERGLVESNLRMSFSISPLANKLTVKKTVNDEDVNTELVNSLGISDESFSVKIDPYTKKGEKVVYTKNGSETVEELPSNNTIALKDSEYAVFENQFELNSEIGITETISSDNDYSYTTSYTLTDEYQEEFEKPYTSESGNGRAIPTFAYKTKSSEEKAPTLYRAEFINKIDTAKVTVAKTYNGTNATSFTYGVKVTLPNGSEVTMNDITVTKNGSTDIDGIPVGSTVTLTEKNADNYTVKYKIGSGTLTDGKTASVTNISEDTTVSFTNTDITNTPAEYTPTVKKYISGAEIPAGDSTTFDFALTQINKDTGAAIGTPDTKQNSRSAVTFDKLTFSSEGEFWYKIEETNSGADFTIDNSSTYSNVYYLKCNVTFNQTTHAFSVAHKYYRSNKTTEVADNAVIFNNIPVVKNGYLKVIKRGSDGEETGFAGTEFSVYKVTGNNVKPADNAEAVTTLTLDAGGNYKVSGELDLGWYAVIETKAPRNYELSGEVKWVEVTAANTTSSPAEVTFVNTLSPDLPTTGGIGVVVFITIGVLLIGAAIVLLKPKKEAKK